MENLKTIPTVVDYKGKTYFGLTFERDVQIISDNEIPEGFTCIGKQRFAHGLKICFLENSIISGLKTPKKELREGEFYINNYNTNFSQQDAEIKLSKMVKECFSKDNSEKHFNWVMKIAKNNMGFNDNHELAAKIVTENWK